MGREYVDQSRGAIKQLLVYFLFFPALFAAYLGAALDNMLSVVSRHRFRTCLQHPS